MEKIMDSISSGIKPSEAVSKFVHGIAFNTWNFCKKPEKIYLSGGFCKNKCRLSLFVDDIFNNDIWYDNNYSAFQRTETTTNYMHHYANLKFSYRFDAKAKKK